jgi:O-antigen/teichoic acid export membrane protein
MAEAGAISTQPATSGPAGRPWAGWPAIAAAWHCHRDLLSNAGSLAATTGLTSMLGFAYWALAARLFSQQAVGYGSAAVSTMTLLGTIGMLGMGTVLIGELPRRRSRAGLISAALLASGLGSLLLATSFVQVAPLLSVRFEDLSRTAAQMTVFCSGVVLTAITLVFDQATIGLMRGGLQLSRNLVFAVAKLLILPVAATVLHGQFGVGMTLSWVAGSALSLLPIALRLRFAGDPVIARPHWEVLRRLGKTTLAHNWLNLAITVPRSLIPVLVIVVVSPSANAAFYAAWTLSGFLYIIPTHLGTVLFAVAASDPQAITRKLRFSLRLSLLLGFPGMLIMGLGAHLALSMFGANYARTATLSLCLLVIGYMPAIPKFHYIAVCRATGKISRAAAFFTLAAVAEVGAAAVGGSLDGLPGLSLMLLGVFFLEGLVTGPAVLRTVRRVGRHRRGSKRVAPPGGAPPMDRATTGHQQHGAPSAHIAPGRPNPRNPGPAGLANPGTTLPPPLGPPPSHLISHSPPASGHDIPALPHTRYRDHSRTGRSGPRCGQAFPPGE